jgi:uncharacterized protein (TIGR02594 family)
MQTAGHPSLTTFPPHPQADKPSGLATDSSGCFFLLHDERDFSMKPSWTTLVLCSLALAYSGTAYAGGHHRHHRHVDAVAQDDAALGLGSSSLVDEARKYLGTNPTGRRSLWCGAFMDMVLKRTGHTGGGNLALGYEHYGTRVSGPQVGAIAVMGRHGGGHVGVVSGVDASGNPIIVSGNHNNTVAESVYPRSRIAAYVLPN